MPCMTEGDKLPYLPDPLAMHVGGADFRSPGLPAGPAHRDSGLTTDAKWPDALPFKIELYEKPGEVPHFDAARARSSSRCRKPRARLCASASRPTKATR